MCLMPLNISLDPQNPNVCSIVHSSIHLVIIQFNSKIKQCIVEWKYIWIGYRHLDSYQDNQEIHGMLY